MKLKTNKDRIRDCIIKQGVEHLACSYKKDVATAWIYRKITVKKMKLLANALLRLRAVSVKQVNIILKEEMYILEKDKRALRITKV